MNYGLNKSLRLLLFAVGIFGMLACSPPSYLYDLGITQFCRDGQSIVTYQSFITYFSQAIGEPKYSELKAATQDGGKSWKLQMSEGDCPHQELTYPFDAPIQTLHSDGKTFHIVPYDGIYRKIGDDESIKEFDLSQLYHDARFLYFAEKRDEIIYSTYDSRLRFYRPVVWDVIDDPTTGNTLFAMGLWGNRNKSKRSLIGVLA